jgi:hypothetical protein
MQVVSIFLLLLHWLARPELEHSICVFVMFYTLFWFFFLLAVWRRFLREFGHVVGEDGHFV